MKATMIRYSSHRVNYENDIPFLVEVKLYKIDRTIFSRPKAPYYIEVCNNRHVLQEYLYEDKAFKTFMEVSAFWHFEEIRHNMIQPNENFAEEAYLIKKEDFYNTSLGLAFTFAGFQYNDSSNSFSAFLIYRGNINCIAKRFKTANIMVDSQDKIAWKLTDKSIHLCKLNTHCETLYIHNDYSRFFQVASSNIIQSLFNLNPTKCKILYSDCKLS